MEVENKNSSGGAEMEAAAASEKGKDQVMVADKSKIRCGDLALRFLAFALTLVAAIVLGVNKETTIALVRQDPKLPPLNLPVTAKWHYLSAFVYFVVANSIACAYSAISLVLIMAYGASRKGPPLMVIIFDVVMVALLFSGLSAATAVGILGAKGNSHVHWNKQCNMVDKFCRHVAAALSVSSAASVVFILLVLIAIWNLHKKR